MSYLYSSAPLKDHFDPQSESLPLPILCRGYRSLQQLPRRDPVQALQPIVENGPSLLYGRLYLPQSLLEALVIKRFSSGLQLQLRAVSSKSLRNGGSLLGLAQYDVGKFSVEGLASSDGGLLGVRGVYNFGGDATDSPPPTSTGSEPRTNGNGSDRERIYGRFTAGGEIYYGTLNKSGGVSCGLRFATLPSYRGTPLTATVTLNPLMGSIRASYSVMAGRHCSLATMLDFNVYSYESNWSVGMELWRKEFLRRVEDPAAQLEAPLSTTHSLITTDPAVVKAWSRSMQAKLEWRLDEPAAHAPTSLESQKEMLSRTETAGGKEEDYSGVIKARISQNSTIGILWEGRVKALIYSIGSGIDLHRPDQPFRTLGLEVQYSS